MHKIATFVFWTTLGLYLVTLFTVSYVGVYLTYVAVPVIVLAGLVMRFSRRRAEPPSAFENAAKAVSNGLSVFATSMEKLASDAERATAELRARAEEQRASRAEEQTHAVSDASRALRRAKLEKLRLFSNLESGTITCEVFETETARIENEIAALKNIQRLPSSG